MRGKEVEEFEKGNPFDLELFLLLLLYFFRCRSLSVVAFYYFSVETWDHEEGIISCPYI